MASNVNDTIPQDGDFILATPIRANFQHIKSEIEALQGVGPITVTWGDITGAIAANATLTAALNGKQATLVSATSIRTVNGTTLLGAGDVAVAARAGDLSGTASSTTVSALRGHMIAGATPADGDVLTWNAAQSWWEPRPPATGPVAQVPVVTVGSISGVAGTAITTHQVVASNPPITNYTVTPALPANLSLNASNGQITGIPVATQAATQYTVTATNAHGPSAGTNNLTITVVATLTAPVVTPGQTVSGNVGTAITPYQIQTTGGAPTSFTPTPALPGGLSLSSSGLITGTPAAGTAGTHPIGIVAGNAAGNSPSVNISITIAAAVIPGLWEVTRILPSNVAVISIAATKAALGPVTSWAGWNPAYAADVTDDLYDAATPAAQTVRLFATFQGQPEVEVPFDNFTNATVTGNAIRQWGYDSGDNTVYLDGGQNGSGNPVQLRLVRV